MWNLFVLLFVVFVVIGCIYETVKWIRWRMNPLYKYSRPYKTTAKVVDTRSMRQRVPVSVSSASFDEPVESVSDPDYDPDMGNGRGPGYGGCGGM
jgi:hypothetical protein